MCPITFTTIKCNCDFNKIISYTTQVKTKYKVKEKNVGRRKKNMAKTTKTAATKATAKTTDETKVTTKATTKTTAKKATTKAAVATPATEEKKVVETAVKVEEKVEPAKVEIKEETSAKATKTTKSAAKTTKTATKATKTTKTASVKEEVKAEVIVEYAGTQVSIEKVIEDVKKTFVAEGNTEEIKSVKVYLKPEEHAAYYVINDSIEGRMDVYFC